VPPVPPVPPVTPTSVTVHAPGAVPPASFMTMYGVVIPAHENIVVQRQRNLNGVWTVLEQTTTSPDGTYSFMVGPFTTHTTYLYRVMALADHLHTAGISNDLVVNAY
ncbi:MAG: hypothetical protein WCP28_22500, partial [Actinomycetes bacterium]